ncbi:MAG: CCA tRNA nucleotidyltransferase [Planctomycetes bacterium]|nr:CCA tRNA nucleotidyltransferase [Planctomycetota bacterium]
MTNRQAAIKIIKRLCDNGFEALLAGGCVRDMLLGRPAKDFDVATDATPKDVIRLFKRTLKIGAHFGVVVVLMEDQRVEVATFRSDFDYTDGRRPSRVEFVTAKEDASRRDFTINGMFYDPGKKEVTDYVNGQADLKKKIIRTIGDPYERFGEDYLRMLRAVRFATQLQFAIAPASWKAVCGNAKNITKVSGERISIEIENILINPNRSSGAVMLVKSGLAESIFPGFVSEQAKFAIKALGELRKKVDFALALACLFAGCTTKFALEKCVVLMLSRSQNRHIKFLLTNRGKLLDEQISVAELKRLLAKPYFWDLYELQRAIQRAKGGGKENITALIKLRRRIQALGDAEFKPKPLLNGHDLIRLGAVSGPRLGQLSEEMYIAQLEGQLQTKKQAEQWVQKWLEKHKRIV